MLAETTEQAECVTAMLALEGKGTAVHLLDINALAEVGEVVRVDEGAQILALGHQGEIDIVEAAAGRAGSGFEVENHVRHADELAVTAPAFELGVQMGLHVLGEVVAVEAVLVALVTGYDGALVGRV